MIQADTQIPVSFHDSHMKASPPSFNHISRNLPPALQWHYKILQALALEEDLPEKPDDKTIPKYRQIDKVSHAFSPVHSPNIILIRYLFSQRAGPYVTEWGIALEKYHSAHEQETRSSSKRPVDDLPIHSKKPRIVADDANIDDAQMKEFFEKQEIHKVYIYLSFFRLFLYFLFFFSFFFIRWVRGETEARSIGGSWLIRNCLVVLAYGCDAEDMATWEGNGFERKESGSDK